MQQNADTVRQDACGTKAGDRAADQHDRHAGRDGRDDGPGRKYAEPCQQRSLAAELVASRAGGDDQAGEDHHVGVDDPQQIRGRRL